MGTTKFKRFAAAGAISGTLSFAVLGLGAGLANADDDGPGVPWVPWQPGQIVGDWVQPWIQGGQWGQGQWGQGQWGQGQW